jgi:hypothetical protein
MGTTREMSGVVSATGEKVGTLEIGAMVSRTPLRYNCKCVQCSTCSTVSHAEIRNGAAHCRNSACGTEATTRRLAAERRAGKRDAIVSAREAEAEAERARRRAAVARMEAETSEHQMGKPLSAYRSNDPGPMTERQRLAIKERRDAEIAAIRAAENDVQETFRQIARLQREVLIDPNFYDFELYVSPELVGASMPTSDATAYNVRQFEEFIDQHPDFLPSPRNLDFLGDYFERHGLRIVSSDMISRLYARMVEAGVPFEQLEPERELDPKPQPQPKRKVAPRSAPPSKPVYEGWDLVTGEKRTFSEREVRDMSSETYKRIFRLTPDKLTLPNVGPGPKPNH